MKGMFISIEGSEGAGKSTAVRCIENYLYERNVEAIVTREPGGTDIAEEIRGVLLKHHEEVMVAETEALLMFASRAQHVSQKIIPAINEGKWVISDRFTDASYAYQGGGRKLGLEKIVALKKWVLDSYDPDLTILLDVPLEVGVERLSRRRSLDRIELEQRDFFERVRSTYLDLAARYPKRYRVVRSDTTIDEMKESLKQIIDEAYTVWKKRWELA